MAPQLTASEMNCGLVGSRNSVAAPILLQHTKQGFASKQQAFANIVAAINIRVVDQALPADGGARLLEVHAHDDEQLLTELVLSLANRCA